MAALIALVALPIVWMTDFTGGVIPQWGGRYILTSGLLLGVVGIARLREVGPLGPHAASWSWPSGSRCSAWSWMSQRTHEVAQAGAWISARPEPVVVSDVQFWLRESGSYEPDHRWLTVDEPGRARPAPPGSSPTPGSTASA